MTQSYFQSLLSGSVVVVLNLIFLQVFYWANSSFVAFCWKVWSWPHQSGFSVGALKLLTANSNWSFINTSWEKKIRKHHRHWEMSAEVMVFSKCCISGIKRLLFHNVKNSQNLIVNDTPLVQMSWSFPLVPIPVPSWFHHGPPAQEQPLGIPVLLHGVSSHELIIIFMEWK